MPTRERRKLRSRRAETISPGSTRRMCPGHVLLLLAFLASLSYEAEARTRRTTGSFQQEALQKGDIDIVVHVEPTASPKETVAEQIHYLAEVHGVNAHDIHVRKVSGHLEADFDLEVPTDMALADAHTTATRLEEAVLQTNPQVQRVNTHLEASPMMIVPRRDVTAQYPEPATHLRRLANEIVGAGSDHEIHLYRAQEPMPERDVVLHTTFAASAPLSQVHIQTEEIKRTFRQAYPTLGAITIHMEPPEEQAERPTR